MSQVEIDKLEEWLRHALTSRITQAERERDKLLADIAKAVEALPDYCNQLSKKADQDMESKHENRAQYKAAKALSRLTTLIAGICKSVSIPKDKDSTALRTLQRELSRTASEGAQLRSEYLHQIRPFYIIDMMTFGGNIDKLRRLSEELHNFLMGHGGILKSLEELNEKMKSLNRLRSTRDSISAQRRTVEEKLTETKRTDGLLRQQVAQIRQNQKMREYIQIDRHLRDLRVELLRTGFSRLGRPLRKLGSLSERGNYPLPIEVRESAKEYLRRPFATFLSEQEGYPKLKSVMSALSNAVSSGKLALKQREAKKVTDRSEQVISHNSLLAIQTEAKALKQRYDQCLTDQETASLVQAMKTLRQKGRSNLTLVKGLEDELRRTIETEAKANDQVNVLTKEIEDFSSKFAGVGVRIQPSN
jgi:hypothetical protein